MKNRVKRLCVTAAGIALFVVFSLCLQVPVFENYYLCLGYYAMAVWTYSFGAAAGTAVGVFGVVLYCLLTNGLRGMPGWALGNVPVGVVTGLVFARTKRSDNRAAAAVFDAAAVVFSVTAGILGVKSLTECLLYSQPLLLRAGKNAYAWAADTAVLLTALPLCRVLDPVIKRMTADLSAARGDQT